MGWLVIKQSTRRKYIQGEKSKTYNILTSFFLFSEEMSAKSLIRYRSEVGATDPLSGQQWHGGHDSQGKKSPTGSLASDGASVQRSSPGSRGTILEEDSFDEGIDDILAQNPSCNEETTTSSTDSLLQ